MRLLFYFVLSLFIYSCDENSTDDSISNNIVIVSLQDSDGVSFVNADNLDIINQLDIDLDNCSENLVVNLAASAPSITRWSYDNEKGRMLFSTKLLFIIVGCLYNFDMPKPKPTV